jgi:hypothetical protein
VQKEEEKFDETNPWKGRKSEFFVMVQSEIPDPESDPLNPMNLELNDDQWDFILLFYPEYAESPF